MAGVIVLSTLCCLFISINCQTSKTFTLKELVSDRFIYAGNNNEWFSKNAIRNSACPSSSATIKISNQIQSTGFFQQKNIDDQYKSCSVRRVTCDRNIKYRSVEGSCNNLRNPTWGMVNTTLMRVLHANYRNGTSYEPPVSSNGQPLPSARLLSSVFFPDVYNSDHQVSLAGMQWGQFITHDIIQTAPPSEPTDCCNEATKNDEKICLPIHISTNDPFYSKFNQTCINMPRDLYILSPKCSKDAEQFNAVTHFFDGSQIYGSDINVAKKLREFKSGRLLTQTCTNGQHFLPSMNPSASCNTINDTTRFLAGDNRVNQNPQLAIFHTLFVREHNRIVEKLQQLHSNWNDEILYQEGRSIVIAELQHITYNEWLPLMLGKSFMNKYGLYSNQLRNFTYNNKLAPVTINSFSSSANRVGHSAIQGQLRLFASYSGCPVRTLKFSNVINHADMILQNELFDEFTRGLTKQSMQKIDNFHTDQITQQLFHGNKSYGDDLMSVDIQRGRDHGIPSYVEFVRLCSGEKPKNFTELRKFIAPKFVSQLQQYYTSVEDIDFFIGGVLETRKRDTRVGPTFGCIMAEQFYRYKYGDRFWYEIRGQAHSFTNAQVHEIKKATLSRIICDNSNNIKNIARQSFLIISNRTSIEACSNIPSININRWK